MTSKNLFLYDLAIVAIFKDEGKYLKEWIDYHLLAGVEHFYLYNNDSSDDYAEVLAPYVAANLVTLTDCPGKLQMFPAYDDAIAKYRFDCRYMAFIDLDEFIYPKTGQSIAEVVDEILSQNPKAAALGINWQCFGSNGQDKADYSRGVLERFTRRAPRDWFFVTEDNFQEGNLYIKSVVNPRRVEFFLSPHYAKYSSGLNSINEVGLETYCAGSHPIAADKIVINHYYTKSREEFLNKINRGCPDLLVIHRDIKMFNLRDCNDEFDDGILDYRATRADKFSLEEDEERVRRVEKSLIEILTQRSPFDAPAEFFVGKLETFLTCRAVAEKFDIKIGARSAEEYALAWIYQTLTKADLLTQAEIYQFIHELPEILSRPFPLCKKLNFLTQKVVIPSFCEALKFAGDWSARGELLQIQKLLRLLNYSKEAGDS